MLKVRALAAALLAAALAVGVSGCTFLGGEVLPRQYDPSDGVGADVGDLAVRNAFLVTDDGERGNLILSVVNTTPESLPLSLQYESTAPDAVNGRTTVDIRVPAASTITFGWQDSEQLVLEGIDAPLGGLFPVYLTSGDAEGVEVQLPTLDESLSQYTNLAPDPVPSPEPPIVVDPTPIPEPTEGTLPDAVDQNPDGTEPGDAVDSGTE